MFSSKTTPRLKSDVAAAVLAADDPENRFLRPPYRQLMPNEVPAAWSGDFELFGTRWATALRVLCHEAAGRLNVWRKYSWNLRIRKFVFRTVASNVVAMILFLCLVCLFESPVLQGDHCFIPVTWRVYGFPLKRQPWYLWPYPGITHELFQTVQHMSHSTLQNLEPLSLDMSCCCIIAVSWFFRPKVYVTSLRLIIASWFWAGQPSRFGIIFSN